MGLGHAVLQTPSPGAEHVLPEGMCQIQRVAAVPHPEPALGPPASPGELFVRFESWNKGMSQCGDSRSLTSSWGLVLLGCQYPWTVVALPLLVNLIPFTLVNLI